jgi:hypothetical protein
MERNLAEWRRMDVLSEFSLTKGMYVLENIKINKKSRIMAPNLIKKKVARLALEYCRAVSLQIGLDTDRPRT